MLCFMQMTQTVKKRHSRLSSIARLPGVDKSYKKYIENHANFCDFCEIERSASKVIADHQYFRIVTNAFPYAVWDGGRVEEHFLIAPHRHIESVSNFTDDERREYISLISHYESLGYCFYGRGRGSNYKSIPHQHTHIMKFTQPISIQIYLGRLGVSKFF